MNAVGEVDVLTADAWRTEKAEYEHLHANVR
jgi:hypothetical protein